MTTPPLQPGQYWRTRSGRIVYVASILPEWMNDPLPVMAVMKNRNSEHEQDWYRLDGGFFEEGDSDDDLITYLPECDSLDWAPIEYPVYVMSANGSDHYAYIRRDSETSGEIVYQSGLSEPYVWHKGSQSLIDNGTRIYITKEQAESRVKRPAHSEYPKYYKSSMTNSGYFRVDSKDSYFLITPNGSEVKQCGTPDILTRHPFTEITRAEAETRVKRSDAAESPEDWVTQDRVPARPNIDERRYVDSAGLSYGWENAAVINWGPQPATHGVQINGDTLELRCRRKHLPPVADPPKPPSHHAAPEVYSLIHDADKHNHTISQAQHSSFMPILLILRICSAQQSMLSELSAQVDALRAEKTNRGGCCGQPD